MDAGLLVNPSLDCRSEFGAKLQPKSIIVHFVPRKTRLDFADKALNPTAEVSHPRVEVLSSILGGDNIIVQRKRSVHRAISRIFMVALWNRADHYIFML